MIFINGKLLAIYSRKSKFTGKGESIKNQIDKCKKQLIFKYGSVYDNIEDQIKTYSDEGFTGYNMDRPEFQRLLKDITKNKIKVVIVYKLDRISRNVTDFCNLKDKFTKYNIDFISVTEHFDTSTPLGNAMLMISSVFAQLERDTIAERVRDNMYDLAKTGRWLGGNTPLGYTSEKIEIIDSDDKKRKLYKLVEIPEEKKVIELLWDKLRELKGIHKLESYLMQNDIRTRNGNYFSRFSLMNIFKNPVYAVADEKTLQFFQSMGADVYANEKDLDGKHGLIAYNKRHERKGKADIENDVSDWIIAVGKHEGIISSDKFIESWNLLIKNKDKRFRRPQQNESILSGLIRCQHCGSYMRPRLRATYNSNGKRNFSYLCELKDKSRKQLCQCKNVDGLETDRLVIQKIKELTLPTDKFIKSLKDSTNGKPIEISRKQNELQRLKMVYSNNKIKLEKLINKLVEVDEEIMSDVTNQIKKIKNQNSETENQIKELESNITQKNDQTTIVEMATNLINNYMKYFDNLDLIDKKTLIRTIITSALCDGENVCINLIGSSLENKNPRGGDGRSYP
ncbi:MAG: recombinase family protein [Bacilli bacterium]|nr:recombinase family protein [Bacilli bacterium]